MLFKIKWLCFAVADFWRKTKHLEKNFKKVLALV